MGGEAAGAFDSRPIAAESILFDRAVQKVLQPAVGARFAGRPLFCESCAPVGRAGEQRPAIQVVALRQPAVSVPGWMRQGARGIGGHPWLPAFEAGAPKWREYLVRPARPGADGPRLEHEAGLEARRIKSLFPCPGFDAGVDAAFRSAVPAVPPEMGGSGFGSQLLDDSGSAPASKDQSGACRFQTAGQGHQ
ncbi:hypothetical protein D9M72_436900 [compost metagenome]